MGELDIGALLLGEGEKRRAAPEPAAAAPTPEGFGGLDLGTVLLGDPSRKPSSGELDMLVPPELAAAISPSRNPIYKPVVRPREPNEVPPWSFGECAAKYYDTAALLESAYFDMSRAPEERKGDWNDVLEGWLKRLRDRAIDLNAHLEARGDKYRVPTPSPFFDKAEDIEIADVEPWIGRGGKLMVHTLGQRVWKAPGIEASKAAMVESPLRQFIMAKMGPGAPMENIIAAEDVELRRAQGRFRELQSDHFDLMMRTLPERVRGEDVDWGKPRRDAIEQMKREGYFTGEVEGWYKEGLTIQERGPGGEIEREVQVIERPEWIASPRKLAELNQRYAPGFMGMVRYFWDNPGEAELAYRVLTHEMHQEIGVGEDKIPNWFDAEADDGVTKSILKGVGNLPPGVLRFMGNIPAFVGRLGVSAGASTFEVAAALTNSRVTTDQLQLAAHRNLEAVTNTLHGIAGIFDPSISWQQRKEMFARDPVGAVGIPILVALGVVRGVKGSYKAGKRGMQRVRARYERGVVPYRKGTAEARVYNRIIDEYTKRYGDKPAGLDKMARALRADQRAWAMPLVNKMRAASRARAKVDIAFDEFLAEIKAGRVVDVVNAQGNVVGMQWFDPSGPPPPAQVITPRIAGPLLPAAGTGILRGPIVTPSPPTGALGVAGVGRALPRGPLVTPPPVTPPPAPPPAEAAPGAPPEVPPEMPPEQYIPVVDAQGQHIGWTKPYREWMYMAGRAALERVAEPKPPKEPVPREAMPPTAPPEEPIEVEAVRVRPEDLPAPVDEVPAPDEGEILRIAAEIGELVRPQSLQERIRHRHEQALDIASKKLHVLPEEVLRWSLMADPTKQGSYTGWLIKQQKFKNVRLPEDTARVHNTLQFFDKAKRTARFTWNRDINTYRYFRDLEQVVDELRGTELKSVRETEREVMATGAEDYTENEGWKIVRATTPEAASLLARGTKWCTSDAECARGYLEDGPLYVIFKKEGGKLVKYGQYTDGYDSVMGTSDVPLGGRTDMGAPGQLLPTDLAKLMKPPDDAPNKAKMGYMLHVARGRTPEYEPMLLDAAREGEVVSAEFEDVEPVLTLAIRYARDYMGGRWSELEPILLDSGDTEAIVEYAGVRSSGLAEKSWPEAEPILLELASTYDVADVDSAVDYALMLSRRWPELEKILTGPDTKGHGISRYARVLVKERWPAAEQTILIHKMPGAAEDYARAIERRWPEGEEIILGDPDAIWSYAKGVVEKRWPEGEESLLGHAARNPDRATFLLFRYARDVIGDRWPEAEPAIRADRRTANAYAHAFNLPRNWAGPGAEKVLLDQISKGESYLTAMEGHGYARDVLARRWPELERILLNRYAADEGPPQQLASVMGDYARDLMGGKWPEAERLVTDARRGAGLEAYQRQLEIEVPKPTGLPEPPVPTEPTPVPPKAPVPAAPPEAPAPPVAPPEEPAPPEAPTVPVKAPVLAEPEAPPTPLAKVPIEQSLVARFVPPQNVLDFYAIRGSGVPVEGFADFLSDLARSVIETVEKEIETGSVSKLLPRGNMFAPLTDWDDIWPETKAYMQSDDPALVVAGLNSIIRTVYLNYVLPEHMEDLALQAALMGKAAPENVGRFIERVSPGIERQINALRAGAGQPAITTAPTEPGATPTEPEFPKIWVAPWEEEPGKTITAPTKALATPEPPEPLKPIKVEGLPPITDMLPPYQSDFTPAGDRAYKPIYEPYLQRVRDIGVDQAAKELDILWKERVAARKRGDLPRFRALDKYRFNYKMLIRDVVPYEELEEAIAKLPPLPIQQELRKAPPTAPPAPRELTTPKVSLEEFMKRGAKRVETARVTPQEFKGQWEAATTVDSRADLLEAVANDIVARKDIPRGIEMDALWDALKDNLSNQPVATLNELVDHMTARSTATRDRAKKRIRGELVEALSAIRDDVELEVARVEARRGLREEAAAYDPLSNRINEIIRKWRAVSAKRGFRGTGEEPPPSIGLAIRPVEPGEAARPTMEQVKSGAEIAEGFFKRSPIIGASSPVRQAVRWSIDLVGRSFVYGYDVREFPEFVDDTLIFEHKRRRALRDATDEVAEVVAAIPSPAEYEMFNRMVLLQDLAESATRGEPLPEPADPVWRVLHPGQVRAMTLDEVLKEYQRLQDLSTPEVRETLRRNRELVKTYGDDLVRRGKMDEAERRQMYFPHLVLEYARGVFPGSPQKVKAPFRGYTVRRKGSPRPIEHDYLAGMVQHLTAVKLDNATDDFIQQTADRYHDMAKMNEQTGKAAEGWKVYNPRRGIVPRAKTMYERTLARAVREMFERGDLDGILPEDVLNKTKEDVLRGIEAKELVVIPEEIARKLDKFRTNFERDLWDLSKRTTSWFKSVVLSPYVAGIPWQITNFIGDMLNLFREDPGAFTKMLESGVMSAKAIMMRKEPALPFKIANELGVVDSGFSFTELGRVFKDPRFGRLAPKGTPILMPLRINHEIMSKWRRFSEWRETTPRLAKFLKDMERGKDVRAAAKGAREFTVDYLKATEFERRFLRGALFPFYMFFAKNAWNWTKYVPRHPAEFVAKFMLPRFMADVYNHEYYKKNEENAPEWLRESFHIWLPFKIRGRRAVITVQTPLNLAGRLNPTLDLPRQTIDWVMGYDTRPVDEVVKEYLKSPFEELAMILNPAVRLPFELWAGRSMWGDWTIRPEERTQYALGALVPLFRTYERMRYMGKDVREKDETWRRWNMYLKSPWGVGSLMRFQDLPRAQQARVKKLYFDLKEKRKEITSLKYNMQMSPEEKAKRIRKITLKMREMVKRYQKGER